MGNMKSSASLSYSGTHSVTGFGLSSPRFGRRGARWGGAGWGGRYWFIAVRSEFAATRDERGLSEDDQRTNDIDKPVLGEPVDDILLRYAGYTYSLH